MYNEEINKTLFPSFEYYHVILAKGFNFQVGCFATSSGDSIWIFFILIDDTVQRAAVILMNHFSFVNVNCTQYQ